MLEVKFILMVCRGNICRSPMAEGFFSHQLSQNHPTIKVASAGISALVNHPADPHAQTIMAQHEIDISNHRARQFTEDLIRQASLILVMTNSQLNAITKQFVIAKGRTFLLSYRDNNDILDPFMQSKQAFKKVYEQIENAWQYWKTRI